MNTPEFKDAYASLLKAFVESPEEQYLAKAADLGREMVRASVPPEEIAEIHEEVIQRLAEEFPAKTLLESVQRISTPLMEMLMAYGLAFREQQDERERVHEALRESEQRMELALHGADLGTWDWDIETGDLTFNERWAEMLGYTLDEIEPHLNTWEKLLHPDDMPGVQEVLNAHLEGKTDFYETEHRLRHKSGEWVWVLDKGRVIERDAEGKPLRACGTHLDITERKRAEAEKEKLQAQLNQAQKMEILGQLSGGIAHDFNNLLTVICGYSDMLMPMLPANDPKRKMIDAIQEAGYQAAALTRQLLAFSRKQVLEPKVLDLKAVVSNVEKILRRLIGEDIRLTFVLDPTISPVKIDPGQLEQVIINLALNARDAMPRGGQLAIETVNAKLTVENCPPDCKPGSYVLLSVTDTGSGMTPEVKARIFEPFFTTKEPDKGTGLGLATVYGIIKQSEGHITVCSEPGQGTTFTIYLPQVRESLPSGKSLQGVHLMPHGNETALLVEDEDAVRTLAEHVLRRCGYTVLAAADGREAVRLAQSHQGPIHLLISDVVMPHIDGRVVAEQVAALIPGIKVLFVSGYMDDVVIRHGIVQAETPFLQKPYSPSQLAQKVREVLNRQ